MLDEIKSKWAIDHTKHVVLYLVSIILYIISFVQLFKKGSSEYIAYVFVFIVNALSPFIWLSDYRNLVFSNFGNLSHMIDKEKGQLGNILMQYRSFGIYIASILQFLALFFVLFKNENVRKINLHNRKNTDDDTKNDIETKNTKTEQNDKSILAIFVTIVTVIWALVGHTFSLPTNKDINVSLFENVLYLQEESLQSSNMGFVNNIRLLMSLPLKFIKAIEGKWLAQMNRIQTTPLVKAFSFYVITFIVSFFGIFVRIPRKYYEYKAMSRFNIVNMESPFPRVFERNLDQYRNLSMFFLSTLLSLFICVILYLANSFTNMPKVVLQMLGVVVVAIIFGTLFGKSKEILPNSYSVKALIFFFLCVVFGMLGTPVILGIVQLFTEIGLFEKPIQIFANMMNTEIPFAKTLNIGGLLGILFAFVFIFLTFLLFGLGMKNSWLENVDGKPILMFNVVLVCMAISLYVATSTSYAVSELLYNFIKNIMEIVLVFVAPIAIVILSIVQFIFAYQNNEKYKKNLKLKSKSE